MNADSAQGFIRFTRRLGAALLITATFPLALHAQTVPFTSLYQFTAGADGYFPYQLSLGMDGTFYATSEGGSRGYGTTFRLSPSGTVTTLETFYYTFAAEPGIVIQGSDGYLYGTTGWGGPETSCAGGCGSVYRLNGPNDLTTLHYFNFSEGDSPNRLLQGVDGNFYGTTFSGGSSDCNTYGCGTIFRMAPDGTVTVLYRFTGHSDGYTPSSLIQASDGSFYGTAADGGGPSYSGTVFHLTPDGVFTTIYTFTGGTDGQTPMGIIQGRDGNLYGTTLNGGIEDQGNSYGDGTVFKLTPAGDFTVLHAFDFYDGTGPTSSVIQGADGNFYGTTRQGGNSTNCSTGCGTVFQVTPDGVFTTLHQFSYGDGAYPGGQLAQYSDGTLYGLTTGGGLRTQDFINGFGTAFKVSLPSGPIAPTKLTATAKLLNKAALSWTAAPGAVSYNLYEGPAAQESTTPVQTGLTKTTLTIKGLTRKQTYCYTVAGVNASGVGLPSNEACVTAK